jgi:hypothetical protein
MATKVKDTVVEEPKANLLANPEGKTVEELKEIAKVLQVQHNDANNKASEYQSLRDVQISRRTKAQGALEVILQMIPKEEIESMLKEEQEQEVLNDESNESE